jgi:hypothetical protein
VRINKASFFDELVKLGAVSDLQAQAALDRMDTLERNKPTVEQAARYGALGAGTGLATRALGDTIEHGVQGALSSERFLPRRYAAAAATGGLMAGALPMIRSSLDRRAEMGVLKKYLSQAQPAPSADMPAGVDLPDVPPPRPEN